MISSMNSLEKATYNPHVIGNIKLCTSKYVRVNLTRDIDKHLNRKIELYTDKHD